MSISESACESWREDGRFDQALPRPSRAFSARSTVNLAHPKAWSVFMKPRITMLTLGVDDLETSVKFYRDGLGFPTPGIIGTEFEHGAVAFFDLQAGLKLAVFGRADLAFDVGIRKSERSPSEFSIGHNVRSEAEVDDIMDRAAKAGAAIVKPARKTFWGGYAGYFQDPDGHLWEIAWNPAFLPED
jgi:hypothetical protein